MFDFEKILGFDTLCIIADTIEEHYFLEVSVKDFQEMVVGQIGEPIAGLTAKNIKDFIDEYCER